METSPGAGSMPATQPQPSLDARRRRAVAAGMIGNTLEWYDFGVYGFLATILARQFFPGNDDYVALLQTFGAFAAGFVARPLGSLILGRLGDRIGRRAVLTLTIMLMAAGTIVIGTLPSYAQIGFAAPLILLLARLMQGMAAGGEWGNAAAFLAEWSKPGRRGLHGGMLLSSVSGGLLLGSGVAALLTSVLTTQQMTEWGWRVPFLFGIVLVPVGLYLRRNVEEPPVFVERQIPVRMATSAFLTLLLRAICICMPLLVASYMATVYMPSYAQLHGHIERSLALWANTAALALTVVLAPLVGHLSDRIGRKLPMRIAAAILVVLPFPLFLLIASGVTFGLFLSIQLLLTISVVGFTAIVPSTVAEIFPTSVRSVGAALANAIAGVLGGSSPVISTWLIQETGSVSSPAFLIVFSAAAALVATFGLRETAHTPLR